MSARSLRSSVRGAARHLALDVLASASAVGHQPESLRTPRVHNLYLHEVPPDEERRFRELLRWLVSTGHTFIPYGEGIQRCISGGIDRAYVTFSFDDGFRSNVRAAAILEEFGASGCFFVVTDFIGCTSLPEARSVLGPGIAEPAMSWSDLESLRDAGHEVGNHTRTHKNLATLSPAQIEDEILSARDELIGRLGSVEHFAWPLGRWQHFSTHARDVATKHHVSTASAERGAHGADPAGLGYCPRRDHIMTTWPLRHMQHFVTRSATRAQEPKPWPALQP